MKSSEIRLGQTVFDPRSGALKAADGAEIALRSQSREVLLKLAETPGETVLRQTFFDTVWDGLHVGEDSLVQCIAEIRRAIGDTGKRILQTVPRRGYRLVPTGQTSPGRAIGRPLATALGLAAVVAFGIAALALRPAPTDPARTVAVLPFEDHSIGAAEGVLGDSISESILTDLARYPELSVIARNSSFRFRHGARDLAEIGAALGADLILEGSQHLDGRTLRVTTRLVDMGTLAPIWADRTETEVEDLFDVTNEISLRVAHSVEGKLARIRAETASEDAADALLRNLKVRKILGQGITPGNVASAVEVSRGTVARYPDEPWGHIGLAFALRMQLRFGWASDRDAALDEAIRSAETAVAIAPENYLAHYALGRVRARAGNQIGAIEALDRAIFLNPSSADAMNALAQSYFYIGENDRAFEVLARSARIDPLPNIARSWAMTLTAWQSGDCGAARDSFATFPATPPEARKLEAVVLACLGDTDGAATALSSYRATRPDWTLADERALWDGVWIAEDALDQWLDALRLAGLAD